MGETKTHINYGDITLWLRELGIEYPKTSGIYLIKNVSDGKIYVGSAKNLDKRIKQHIWGLSTKKHRNTYLQNAYHKHGFDNFYFIVLEYDTNPSDLVSKEQFWLDLYKPYISTIGYNIQPTAYSNKSNKLSEETKKKIGDYFRNKPKTAAQNLKNSLAHKGDRNVNFGKPLSEKIKSLFKQLNSERRKSYIFICPNGERVSVTGLDAFCKENNLLASSMSQVASGKQGNHKGWKSDKSLHLKTKYRKSK